MKITIFGLAGSGTSTIGKLLSEKLKYKFMSSGNIFRSWAEKTGYSLYEFENKIIKNDDLIDLKLDNEVEKYGKDNDDFVFESRLAWHFIKDSFKIYIKCEETERYNRIFNREGGKLEDIIQKNKTRETELINRYLRIYPGLQFPPKEEKFNLVIDSTNILPEEILKLVLNKLKLGKSI